ncbi:MAG: class I SAM-dependent methyltransferase [Gemmataceae bacterium]|nr:class I SAM-dependent methyltransferase [Gemmataceae bacterium]
MEPTELCRIAAKTKACKPDWYTPAYHRFFSEWCDRPLRLLEIGVYQGGSLQMWREYFPKASLFAIDINAETLQWNGKIRDCKVTLVDQGSPEALRDYVAKTGGQFDIIVEDGGHTMHQQITSFNVLFPHVVPGGAYVVEDYGTSYWTKFGGKALNAPGTSVSMLKWLVDCINLPLGMDDDHAKKWGESSVAVSPAERASLRSDVEAMHICNSIAIIFKSATRVSKPASYQVEEPAGLMTRLRQALRRAG